MLAPNILDGLSILRRIGINGLDIGKVYRDITLKQFETAVVQAHSDSFSANILTWYKYNAHIETVSDLVVDTVIKNKWTAENIQPLANEEQMRRLAEAKLVSVEIVAKNLSVSLDTLAELADGKNVDLFESGRFFTEEDMIKYPNLISPYSYASKPMGYMSKSTLEKLNRVWGEKLAWKDEFADFDEIVPRLRGSAITEENIRYVASKTGTRPNNMFRALNSVSLVGVDTDKSALLKGLRVIKELQRVINISSDWE